jgi:hypothetical protein
MSQVVAILAHIPEKWIPAFRQGYAPAKEQDGSIRFDRLAQRWHALRESLRRLRVASASNEDVRPAWRGRHHPPMLSFATGAHALLIHQRSLMDRARSHEPESRQPG